MKQVSGIKEAAKILAGKLYKVKIYIDGKPAFQGDMKTDEIKIAYNSITQFLNSLVEDHSPKTVSIQYGESNGSSWKNPAWLFFNANNSESKPSTSGNGFGLNEIDMAPNSLEAIKAQLFIARNELERTSSERDRAINKLDYLEDKNEQLTEKYRELKHEHEDLKRNHQRELDHINKPSFIDKILENEDLMDKLGEALGDNLRPNGLNGADLSPEGQYVLQALQSSAGMDKALARIAAQLNNVTFVHNLKKLLTEFEGQQEPEKLDLTADQ